MSTTHAGTEPIKNVPTAWRPDRRPVRLWESWISLGVGLLMAVVGLMQVMTAEAWHSAPAAGYTLLLSGTSFLALAGLQVARPAPDNHQAVVLYRIVSFALVLPGAFGLAALIATWTS